MVKLLFPLSAVPEFWLWLQLEAQFLCALCSGKQKIKAGMELRALLKLPLTFKRAVSELHHTLCVIRNCSVTAKG